MDLNVLGHRRTTLPAGWTDETSVSVLGHGHVDATATPGADAKVTVIAVLCSVTVVVPPGAQIRLSGGNILGSRKLAVEPGVGPAMEIQAIAALGSIRVKSSQ